MALIQKSGKITFLRANELGDRFGPQGDSIQAEMIVRLDQHLDEAYGIRLRTDDEEIANTAMSNLLRDAFAQEVRVSLDVEIRLGNDVRPDDNNGMIIRVALTK